MGKKREREREKRERRERREREERERERERERAVLGERWGVPDAGHSFGRNEGEQRAVGTPGYLAPELNPCESECGNPSIDVRL